MERISKVHLGPTLGLAFGQQDPKIFIEVH